MCGMMLLSGIGKPYDPNTNQGMVGRNYCYQTSGGGASMIFDDKRFNSFMGAGALSTAAHDFNADTSIIPSSISSAAAASAG